MEELQPDELEQLFGLHGKVAVITGGARGVGRWAAEVFLRRGAEVVITSRSVDEARMAASELADLGRAHGIGVNLAEPGAETRLAEEVEQRTDRVHILINNAGATWGAPFEQYPAAAWAKVLHLDAAVPFLIAQSFVPLLERSATAADPARIINIGSIDGISAGPFDNFAYGVAKAGLAHLTHLLARELGPRQITVNCMAPGPIRTKMTERLLAESMALLRANNPLRRVGEPSDLTGPLLLLAGPAGAYLTGVVLPVDGGFAVNRWCESRPDESRADGQDNDRI